ncbi:MAG: hypothetical protein KAI73_10140 [Rhodospirillaceae bacterium]|nr:hypothetical protein [Rhodospirillaceae bacterium]
MENGWSYFLKLLRASGLTVLASFTLATEAYSFDVHELFETRCGQCHQHSGDVAQERLVIAKGILRGRTSGNDILVFLPKHHGRPNPKETAALYDLFFSQVKGGGVFKDRCAICHVSAREFARLNLIRDCDVVRGRYTGNNLTEFLVNHGRIGADEVDFFIQLMARLAPALDR